MYCIYRVDYIVQLEPYSDVAKIVDEIVGEVEVDTQVMAKM